MKIKVGKDYTMGIQVAKVKEDIAEFKERYTEGDVINAIRSQLDFWGGYPYADTVKFEMTAYPGGSYYNDETHFSFHIILDTEIAFYKIYGYLDMDLNIPNPALCKVKTYKP